MWEVSQKRSKGPWIFGKLDTSALENTPGTSKNQNPWTMEGVQGRTSHRWSESIPATLGIRKDIKAVRVGFLQIFK